MRVIRAYLGQLRHIDRDIESSLAELSKLRGAIPSSANYQLDKVMSSRKSQDQLIDKIIKLNDYVTDRTDRQVDLKLRINKEIDKVPDGEYRALLRFRYCQGLRWSEVARLMHLSIPTVKRKEVESLEAFGKANPEAINNYIRSKS